MKNPPLTLLNETNGINFLQGLYGHGQSHGCFVPSLGEIKADEVMGTAWDNMHMTHICKDEMSTALFALLHLLCKDEKIHKKYHQVIHDDLGDRHVSLYNLCRSLNPPCLGDSNLMDSDIPKQKAT